MTRLQNILVVDDDERVLDILEDALARMGDRFEIIRARDGREARRQAHEVPIDLLITDLHLPKLDGIALTRLLRQADRGLAVIWITAYLDGTTQKEAESMAVSQVIEKPFEVAYIRKRARALLDRQYRGKDDGIMSEQLQAIEVWANHGTLRQFAAELDARLGALEEYHVVLKDNILQVVKTTSEGGLFGIGAHQEESIILEVTDVDGNLTIRQVTADSELVDYLTEALQSH